MNKIETTPIENLACIAPVLGICENFISEETQDALLSQIDNSEELERRGVDVRVDAVGTVFEIPIEGDSLLEDLQKAIYEEVGLPSTHAYSFRIRRYAQGQGHGKHHDGYEINGAKLIASTALYLRAPSTGGERTLPYGQPMHSHSNMQESTSLNISLEDSLFWKRTTPVTLRKRRLQRT